MTKFLTLSILLLSSFTAFSQSDKLVILQGDTLSGKVSILSIDHGSQTIILKKGKDKNRFKAYEITSVIKGEKVYHTYKINNVYQLGLLNIEGYLSLYKFMENEGYSSNEFSTSILIKKDGSYLIIPNLGFKKQLSRFLVDCNTVKNNFSKNKYKQSDLEDIIRDYNACIDKNTININVEKNEKNSNPEKTEKIEALIFSVEKDTSLNNKESILEMLTELKNKTKEGAKIPSYLKSALMNSLESNQELKNQLIQLLE